MITNFGKCSDNMTKDEKIELILRRTVDIYNKETLLEKLNSGKKIDSKIWR